MMPAPRQHRAFCFYHHHRHVLRPQCTDTIETRAHIEERQRKTGSSCLFSGRNRLTGNENRPVGSLCVLCHIFGNSTQRLYEVGYTVIAFTQTVHKKVDSKTHVNVLDAVLGQLKSRPGIVYLKRLNIILDEDSEKGFGLVRSVTPFSDAVSLTNQRRSTQTFPSATATT